MTIQRLNILIFLLGFTAVLPLAALPVSLGQIEIGLESFDGYQEGMAFVSTDEAGTALEFLIAYKGFGLDTISWTFSAGDLDSFRSATADGAWWRSRLLEMSVGQIVTRDAAVTNPALLYAYRGGSFPFDSAEHVLRFVRQGRDYAILLTESSPEAETRRSGEKTLPVFTMHFSGGELPELRDLVSIENMTLVLERYAVEKSAVEAILNSGPGESQ
jgi:hypothetical protein